MPLFTAIHLHFLTVFLLFSCLWAPIEGSSPDNSGYLPKASPTPMRMKASAHDSLSRFVMRNKKGYQIIANEERFSNYPCYFLVWVAVGYYLWKKILGITGYRFHPTDFELLHFYLQNKNLGRDSLVQAIAEVDDICGLEPWQLPGHSNIHSGDQVWYFFHRPSFKYQNSSRINRTTNEGYWKPTGKPRKIMARDMATEIGKKKTLVFYKGHVDKIKTGWIMHEYELIATLPNQTTFVLCKLKRKFEKDEVSCIEECQSSQYLPPNLGNYIENNANEAEAARCLTDKADPNKMLAQVEVHCCHYPVAENAIRNNPSVTEIPIEQEAPQEQSGSNERSNQHNSTVDTIPSISKDDTAENSVQMDFISNMAGPSMDEVFEKLEGLAEVKGNSCGQVLDDWISEYLNAFEDQPSSIHEEQNLTALNNLSCADMMESPQAINLSRKKSRTVYEGFDFDMMSQYV
ncbi:hypothetical protein V6N13_146695 [Hibiscus sabdariffa]